MIARLSGRAARVLALALVLSIVAPTLGLFPPGTGLLPRAHALEFPADGPGDPGWNVQTNGPAAASSLGDWYTNSAEGDHDHYIAIVVPCEWPAATPVNVDLYSAEINANGTDVGDLEEPGNGGTAQFALYGPYADRTVSDAVQPLAGDPLELASTDYPEVTSGGALPSWVRLTTIDVAATGCGIYLLRSAVLEATSTAQNGWRLRVGSGAVGTVLTSDPDGTAGTNDELLVGIYETTFQNDDGGGGCITFHEYVQPGQAEIRFHNFDMDGNASLSYVAPSGATPGTPTLSANDVWNNGRTGGDLISGGDVEPGWWEIDLCANDHNQFIQEGQTRVMAFLEAPPEPDVSAAKSGAPDPVTVGGTLTWTVAVANDPGATGAAVDVEVTDVLPAGVSFVACAWQDAAGSCSESGGTVTATRPSIHAGAIASLDITVTIDEGATSPVSNAATVDFTDAVGNVYDDVTTAAESTVVWSPASGGEVCWAVADDGDELVRIDRATGDMTEVATVDPGSDFETAAYRATTSTLYSADGTSLGTVDTASGAFTALGTVAGTSELDSMAFHPFTDGLFVVDTVAGDDVLMELDPADGAVLSSATVTPVSGQDDVADLAISPVTGVAYILLGTLAGDSYTTQRLVELDLASGATTDVGAVTDGPAGPAVSDLSGLTFAVDGTLLSSTGDGGSDPGTLWTIDPATAVATMVGPISVGSDHEALACLTGAPNSIAGTLFQDRDADGVFDAGEPTRDGVTITLQRTDGTVLDTATTAAGGAYQFTFAATGTFEVVLDSADPSFAGELVTPGDTVTVDFGTAVGEVRTVDFWYRKGLIGGIAWLDLDRDGVRNGADAALTDATVTVTLWEETNASAGLQTTGPTPDTVVGGPTASAADGSYAFVDLDAGTYYLQSDPGARILTSKDAGTDDTLDSDIDPTTGVSDAIVLAAGQHEAAVDTGVWDTGSITVRVFEDVDGDAVLDGGDSLLDGIDVRLYRDTNANGTLEIGTDALVAGPTATSGGAVTFSALDPGTYFTDVDEAQVALQVSGAVLRTGNDPQAVVVTSGAATDVDVGYYSPVSIGDLVWEDLDGDGIYEPGAGEPTVDGVVVNLRDDEGGVLATDTTGSVNPGEYAFAGLVPGAYEIEFVLPLGYVFSPRDQGSDDTLDSDADPADGRTGLVTYASGDTTSDVDAGVYRRGSIAGRVWDDLDADSLDEPADPTNPEPGVAGLTVNLLDGAGNPLPVAPATTAADGSYGFSDLDPGDYIVEVVLDPGRVFSPQVDDSDVDPADGRSDVVTITSDLAVMGVDAGTYEPVSLSGRLWVDTDGDGTQNDGATGVAGETVAITGPGGPYSVVTGADGQWDTSGLGVDLAPGSYTIDYPVPAGAFVFTAADQGDDDLDSDVDASGQVSVSLLSGESSDVDAGVYEPVTIGDLVWTDVDGDGVFTAVDSGLNGVTVELLDGGVVVGSTVSATVGSDDGRYEFSGRAPGTYTVRFVAPAGSVFTTQDAAAATEATDSDADPADGETDPVTLTSGQTRDDVDAGLYVPVSIGDRVWDDLDGDGVQDAGEPGLAGVSLSLSGPNGFSASTTSADGTGVLALGGYEFSGLAPGDYTLTVTVPAGRALSPTGAGTPATDSDPDVVTGQAGVTVTSGSGTDAVDVGLYETSTVGDRIWVDDDGDGVQDAGEVDLSGLSVEVSLLQGGLVATRPDGSLLQVITSTGVYAIGDVPPGDYQVRFDLPDGYRFTTGDVGSDDTIDSDVVSVDGSDPTVGTTGTVTADPSVSTVITHVDAGAFLLGSIAGEVWEDVDGDGLRDAGDDPVAGTRVDLYLASDTATSIADVTVDGSGAYSFTDLVPAGYVVGFTPPAGQDLTEQGADSDPAKDTGLTPTVTVTSGLDVIGVDAGVFTLVTIGDLVWTDVDGDGLQTVLEPGIGDVTVRLHDPGDLATALATTVTSATGAYAFTGVEPGDYVVVVQTPTGMLPTVADAGPDDAADSDVTDGGTSPATAVTGTITVTSGMDDDSVDAGFYTPASIAGRVFDDQDGDGIDDGEPGWGGVTVTLASDHDGDGAYTTEQTTTTAAVTGDYGFTDLRPGPYRITVDTTDLPADAVLTTGNQPLDVTVVSGEALVDQDIGYRQPGTITGLVYEDVAGDGDPTGDPPLAGVDVELRLPDGILVDSDTTDAAGAYSFDLLIPGTYEVHVVDPFRFVLTTGNDPTTVEIVPAATETVDFGFQAFAPSLTMAPDGDLTVEVGPASPVDVAHPHVVTNTGNVTDTYDLSVAGNAWTVTLVRDDDGDGLLDGDETTVVGDTGPLAPGDIFELLAVVTVPAGTPRGTSDTVAVTATSQVGPDDPSDPPIQATATDLTTVVAPVVDITKTSSVGGGFATPGQRVTYTIEVTNLAVDGDVADAQDLTLSDELADPDHGTFDAASFTIDGVLQPDPTAFPLDLGSLAPGTTVTVTVDVVLARPLPDGTTVTDIATASVSNPQLYDAGDAAVADVTDTVTDTIASGPIPLLDMTATPPAGSLIEPGEVVTYRVTLSNRTDATDTWRDIVLVLDLPLADASYIPGSATVAGLAIADGTGGTNPFDPAGPGVPMGDLAPGTSIVATLQIRVDDPIAGGTSLTALAQAVGSNGGPLLGAVTHGVDVAPAVALTPDGLATVEPGTTVVYGHLLTNTGNVTDSYDLTADSDTGFSVRVVDDLDGDGQLDTGEPTISASRTLAPGAFQRLLVVLEVPTGVASGTIDTVTAVAASRGSPGVVGQAFDVTTVVAGELALVKTASPGSSAVNPGQSITYRIEVRNTGGAAVTGVIVTDDTPSSASYRAGTTRLDGVPVPDRSTGDRNPLHSDGGGLGLGDLAPGATRVITFEVQVRSPLPDGTLLVNVAEATGGDGLMATDSVSQLVTASPVIDVAKTASPPAGGVIGPGQVLTYTIQVRNVGNLAATGARLEDEVPLNTTYVAGSTRLDGAPVADAGGPEPAPLAPANGGLLLGRLDPGGATRTVSFQVRVGDPLPQGTVVTNVASVTTAEGVSARSAPVRHTVHVIAGVDLVPDGAVTTEAPGQGVHPHVVTNTGTGTDTIVLSASSAQGWPVTLYRDDDGDGVWDLAEGTVVGSTGPLAPGATFRFFVVVDVPEATPAGRVDVATVTARSSVDAAVSDTAVDTTTVIAPELGFTKAAVPSGDQINPGATITYRLVVTNRGRAAAADVLVSDDTPAGTTYVAGSARIDTTPLPDEPNGDGNPFSLANAGHTLDSVEPGTAVTLSFAVTVPLTTTLGTVVTNTATMAVPNAPDVTAEASHTVTAGPVLDLNKTSVPPETTSLTAGDVVSYTITVANVGALVATGVRVADDTPLNTAYVPGSATVDGATVPDAMPDPNPFASATTGGYLVGDLLPGADPVVLRFDVEVIESVDDAESVRNVATAASGEGASATSPVVEHGIEVVAGATLEPDRDVQATAGTQVVLAHLLTNIGDVPDSYDLTATSNRGWTVRIFQDVDGNGSLDPGDTEVTTTPLLPTSGTLALLVTVDVPTDAVATTTDSVTVRARSVEDPAVLATARDTITVIEGSLTLAKVASPATLTPDAVATYTLTVGNAGSAPIDGVRLFDTAPAGTTYVAGSTTVDGVGVSDATGGTNPLAVGLDLGTLAVGDEVVVSFQVLAGSDPERTVVINAAEAVQADGPSARAGTVQPYDTERGLDITPGTTQQVAPGTTVVYPHTISNIGDLADEVVITATSSFGFAVRVVHDENGDGVADPDEPEIGQAVALEPGASVDVVLVLDVPADAPSGLEDTLIVTATSLAEPGVSVSATDLTVVVAAVLQVVKAAQPDTAVEPGGTVRFGISVTNTGTDPAVDVVVTDPIPAGTTYVAGSTFVDGVPVPDVDGAAPVEPEGPGVALGDLAPGASRIVLFSVTVREDVVPGAILTNVATATSEGTGPVPSSPVALTVVGTSLLDARKDASPAGAVAPGGVLRWTITITNVGSVPVADVLVTDVLAPELTYVAGSTTVDGTSVGDGVAAGTPVAVGALAPGQVRTVSFGTTVGQVSAGTVIQNAATVTNGLTGTSVLSNAATVTVDPLATGLPDTGFGRGRTLSLAVTLFGAGWALLYVARPERRPRPVLERRSP
ncbi:MAG TPA: SdrD B-like domain-containing protein [Nitriliruptorales bacterium]